MRDVRPEAPGISTLTLAPGRRSHRPLVFRPGQFVWLRTAGSMRGLLHDHPFSIASSTTRSSRQLDFTVRHVGDFSSSLANIAPGTRIHLDGPYGSFDSADPDARRLLLVAGGVGITPLMSILRTHADLGDPRPHVLVVGARTELDLLFREELKTLSASMDLTVVSVLSDADATWSGARGVIDRDLLREALGEAANLAGTHAYICGPSAMIDAVRVALIRLGMPAAQLASERFDLI